MVKEATTNNQYLMSCNITQLISVSRLSNMGLNNYTWSLVVKARFVSVGNILESISVHRCRIARLVLPARAIFSSPAIFKREALHWH